jgi:2-oxoglutarate dehydrogenase E2 component (dihydrolipoamide succinyltransferase)
MAEIQLPQLGESVTEGTITKWFKAVGDQVEMDEPLFEVSTDKVDSEVPAPEAGVLTEIRVQEGDTVDVGTVVCVIGGGSGSAAAAAAADDASAADSGDAAHEDAAAAPTPSAPAPAADTAADEPTPSAADQASAPAETAAPAATSNSEQPAATGGGAVLSPLVRRLIKDNNLNPEDITGTGVGGRITRDDVLAVVDQRAGGGPAQQPAARSEEPTRADSAPAAKPAAAGAPSTQPRRPAPMVRGDGDTVVPLSKIRRLTGEHMVASLQTSPHVITAIEVDYEAVERARKPVREQFKEEEGFSLTYLPFIARATIDALDEFPHVNASMGDGGLVVHPRVNLAIAVDLDFEGLLAPVIQGADEMRLRAIARDINSLATLARSKELGPDDLTGGTFTLSNSGSFGTLFVAPIINQPQVAIMSTDGIARRPVVVESANGDESIAIHSVGVLTLSWDHRAFDGAYAAAFMGRIKEILETRDWAAEI